MGRTLMLAAAIYGSAASAEPLAVATTPSATSSEQSRPVLVRRDTPVELMAAREVSTAEATAGTRFKLRVNRAIEVDGKTIVPVGATAFGEVMTATDSGRLGKSGQMTARLLHIQLGDVEIPIEGELSATGTGAGSANVAILFAGVAGFFHRGNNAKIKAGELLSGFVADDVTLDMSGTAPKRVMVSSSQPESAK